MGMIASMTSHVPVAGNGAQGSQLLASLPAREAESLRRDLERVRLDAERPIMHAHAPVRRVYFPESGLVALSVTMADGRTAGVTIVGSDGIVGLAAAFGDPGPMDAAVLVPGVAQVMSAEKFRHAFRESEALRRMVGRYSIAMLRHLSQTVACNRLHSLDQRAARWLGLACDRIGNDTFPVRRSDERSVGKEWPSKCRSE
jgi:CRP-like cAMP-binding protein